MQLALSVSLVCALNSCSGVVRGSGTPGGPSATSATTPGDADRIDVPAAEMSFVPPTGWVEKRVCGLVFGSVELVRRGVNPDPPIILLGKLDHSMFASEEGDDAAAAKTLGLSMGDYFLPDESGENVDEDAQQVQADGLSGASYYFAVRLDDPTRADTQVFTAVMRSGTSRWWLTWLGNPRFPVDKGAARKLAESIRPSHEVTPSSTSSCPSSTTGSR